MLNRAMLIIAMTMDELNIENHVLSLMSMEIVGNLKKISRNFMLRGTENDA